MARARKQLEPTATKSIHAVKQSVVSKPKPKTNRKPAVATAAAGAHVKRPAVTARIRQLLADAGKYPKLDIACGGSKQGPEWIGIDFQDMPGVDIVHDIEIYPWPLPDDSIYLAVGSHIAEHINPAQLGFVKWMNEVWRIMQPGGRLMLSMPYGASYGYIQDPSHCNMCNETTWRYFDPLDPSGFFRFYEPNPWKQVQTNWNVEGFMEVVLEKRAWDKSYRRAK